MSKLHPTPNQLAYKARQRARKRAQRAQARADYVASLAAAGCTPTQHDWAAWDCGCSWGCSHCMYTHQCRRCGEFRR